jgi:hypothetical protein
VEEFLAELFNQLTLQNPFRQWTKSSSTTITWIILFLLRVMGKQIVQSEVLSVKCCHYQSSCKQIVTQRLKCSDAQWLVPEAIDTAKA